MTYNTRFKDSRTNYKENKNIDIETLYRYFTHRHRLGDIDVKNIDNRKQTLMFSMFQHRCPITSYCTIREMQNRVRNARASSGI